MKWSHWLALREKLSEIIFSFSLLENLFLKKSVQQCMKKT